MKVEQEVFIVGDRLFRKGRVVEIDNGLITVKSRDGQSYSMPKDQVFEIEDIALAQYNKVNNIQL